MTSHNPEHGASQTDRAELCQFSRDNADAYALDALTGADLAKMEQHLTWCAACRRAVADIRRVTNVLPFLAEPATPSANAKAGLFARIAEEEPDEQPITYTNPRSAQPETKASEKGASPSSLPWQRWIAPAIIAPLAICLMVLSAWANSLRNEVDTLQEQQNTSESVAQSGLSSTDLQLYALQPSCPECVESGASGQLGGNPDDSMGVVVAWNLDPSEQHQVWCVNKQGERHMVSDLKVEHTGNAFQMIKFPEDLSGYQQIYVARADGSNEHDVELLAAMSEEVEAEPPLNQATPTSGL